MRSFLFETLRLFDSVGAYFIHLHLCILYWNNFSLKNYGYTRSHRTKLRMAQFSERVISRIKERLTVSVLTQRTKWTNTKTYWQNYMSDYQSWRKINVWKNGTRADLVLKRGVVCDQHLSFRNVINFFQNTRGWVIFQRSHDKYTLTRFFSIQFNSCISNVPNTCVLNDFPWDSDLLIYRDLVGRKARPIFVWEH